MERDLLYRNRLPIIYTTRLEDIRILRQQLSNLIFEDVINTIIVDSKPRHIGNLHLTASSKVTKANDFYFKKLKLKRNSQSRGEQGIIYITDISRGRKKQQSPRYMSGNGESKIEDSKENLTSVLIKKPNKIIGTDIRKNDSKPNELLAACKPLQIVLEDIIHYFPKKIDDQNNKVLLISSDEDDDVQILSEPKINATDSTQFPKIFTIKNTQLFEQCLKESDIKDTVILMYNLFLNKVESYEIDVKYNVNRTNTIKFCDIPKMKANSKFNNKYKSIFNIIVCCWNNRQSYILLLNSYKKYSHIAQYICIQHPCKELHCECCCTKSEKNCNIERINRRKKMNNLIADVNNNLFGIIHNEPHHIVIISQSVNKKTDNLITAALKFPSLYKKEAKWRDIQKDTNICNNVCYKHECSRLLSLRNKNNGSEELYEFGSFPNSSSDLIYSKVIYNDKPNSSWLLNTFSVPHKRLNCKYTDPKDRDAYISLIESTSCIPLTSYLKIPTTLHHGKSKKKEPILPNSAEICIPECLSGWSSSPVSASENDSGNNVTKTINSLIKGIMYRFRDVRLIINSDGKVSAALNASLNTLTSSELMILSEILANAQTHVDKLGLKPGTYINPNSTLSFISQFSQNVNNETERNVSKSNKPKTSLNPNIASPMSFISNSSQNNFNSTQTNVSQNCKPGISLNPNLPTTFSLQAPHIFVNLPDTNVVEHDNPEISAKSSPSTSYMSHFHNFIKPTQIDVSEKNVEENIDNQQSENAKSKNLLSFSKMICKNKKEYETSFRNYISHRTQPTPKITNVFSLNNTSYITNKVETKETVDSSDNNSVNNPNIIKNLCLKEIETSLSLLDSEQDSIALTSRKRKKRLRPYSLIRPIKKPRIRVKTAPEISLSSNIVSSNVSNYQQIDLTSLPVKEPVDYISEPGPSDTSKKAVVGLNSAQVSPLILYGPLPISTDLVTNSYRLRDLLTSEPKKMWFPPT